MAITDITTACAVNEVLRFLYPSLGSPSVGPVDLEAAAQHLAREASKRLGAGVNAAAVRQAAAIDGARIQALLSSGGGR